VVDARVGHDDKARLLERASDVVGEATGGKATCDRLGTSVGGVLEHCAVAVWAGGDDTDVVRVLDSGNDTGSENKLLPGLANVDDMDTVSSSLPNIGKHLLVAVLAANVGLRGQEELDLLIGCAEDRGEF